MRQDFRAGLTALSFIVLVACGGVSNTTDSPGTPGSPGDISFGLKVDSLKLTSVQGLSLFIALDIDIIREQAQNETYSLKVVDDSHLLKDWHFTVTVGEGQLQFHTAPGLAPGTYKGTIVLEADCQAGCHRVIGNTKLPVQLIVQPATHLTTLSALTGGTDAQTAMGDNAHDNYVPVTLDASKFNSRWIHKPFSSRDDQGLAATSAAVTDAAHHLAAVPIRGGFRVFDETDGTELWHFSLSAATQVNIALYNGTLYAARDDGAGNTLVDAYADDTGAPVFNTSVACTDCARDTPIVAGGKLILRPDPTLLTALDAATGTQLWVGAVAGDGTVAADASDVYFYVPNNSSPGAAGVPGFTALDQASGNLLWQIARPADDAHTPLTALPGGIPTLDSQGGAVMRLNSTQVVGAPVERYDLATHTVLWSVGLQIGRFAGYNRLPGVFAVDSDTVYVESSDGITALSLANGKPKWSVPSEGLVTYLLVTKNLLFVSDDVSTYAIDLASHNIVWRFPIGGPGLAISADGVLYIVGSDILAAVNLH